MTAKEKRDLRLALNLAIQWELSLMDSNEPAPFYRASKEQQKTIRQCQRNIKSFESLRAKLTPSSKQEPQ